MTMGQFVSESEAKFIAGLLEEKFVNFSFPVKDLYLLSRPDKTGPVEQMRVRLGPSQALNAPSLTLAASEYASLKRAGVELNTSRTRSVLLERCSCDAEAFGKQKNVSGINAMLADLAHNKVEMDSKLLNTVMGAYMRCGLPQLAIDVFQANVGDAPPAEADATSSEAAAATSIPGFFIAEEKQEDKALKVEASVHCYSRLITALGHVGELDRAHVVLERMVESGPAPTIRVINALLGACVRTGNLTAAQKLFFSLKGERGAGFASFVTPATDAGVCVSLQPDEYSFNIMVNAYARAKLVEPAFKILLEMRRANCTPDRITYTTLIKACVNAGQMDRARGLLDEMAEAGQLDVFPFNAIMAGLAKKKQWREVNETLQRMESEHVEPDLMTYSHVITACVRASRVSEAKKVFRNMQDKGVVPNLQVYSTMMAGFGAIGALNEAQQLFKLMQERRVRPNEFTMSSLIEAYLKAGYATEALKLQERMPEMRLRMDDVLETQRIRALAQLGLFDNATLALQAFVSRVKLQGGKEGSGGWKRASIGAIPYNELIKQAHALQRRDTAKDVLAMMLKDGVSPNRMTYELVCCMCVCVCVCVYLCRERKERKGK